MSSKTYLSPLCSCIHCHEVKSSKGIHSHVIGKHGTPEEQQRFSGKGGGRKQNHSKQKEDAANMKIKAKTEYANTPNHCIECGLCLVYEKRRGTFCNASCSAKYNNKYKLPRTTESKRKTSTSLIQTLNSMSDTEYAKWVNLTHPTKRQNTVIRSAKNKFKDLVFGDYTRVYRCVCKFSGKVFYSKTVKQIHPDLCKTRNDYARSCSFKFGISSYPFMVYKC